MENEKICPKCESEDVRFEDVKVDEIKGNWICNECGFFDVDFPEKEGEKKEDMEEENNVEEIL
jgi:hypothetical protein